MKKQLRWVLDMRLSSRITERKKMRLEDYKDIYRSTSKGLSGVLK